MLRPGCKAGKDLRPWLRRVTAGPPE